MLGKHAKKEEVTESLPDDEETIEKAQATLHFQGEAWIDDYARETDYSAEFTVPLSDLRSDDGSWYIHGTVSAHHVSDMLKNHDNAPEKVQKWQGPFTITLKTWGV